MGKSSLVSQLRTASMTSFSCVVFLSRDRVPSYYESWLRPMEYPSSYCRVPSVGDESVCCVGTGIPPELLLPHPAYAARWVSIFVWRYLGNDNPPLVA